jgi:hydrogenase maturation factor
VTASDGRGFTPACADEHCITCGDQGLPLRIVALEGDGLARCSDDAAPSEPDTTVDVQLVGEVAPGDLVLVHAGVALVRLDGAPA